jgi:threonine dehydrogenase-like Zn-dependent dehydrogenase
VIINERQFFPVPDDVPLSLATMLLDAMGTTGHAVERAQSVRRDIKSVYIAGAGPIGLGLLVQCRARLGSDVPLYISDVSAWRREFARTLGGIPVDATDTEAIRGLGPVSVSFDSTGKTIARQLAIDVLASRGVFMVVGGQEGFSFTDVGEELLPRELSILGSEYFDYAEFDRNLTDLLQHRELMEQLVTHTFPIGELDRAFDAFLAGETGKVVVTQEDA